MGKIRKPFHGVWNIIRFNWHYYLCSIGFIILLFFLKNYFTQIFQIASVFLLVMIAGTIIITLLVSYYIYDVSDLYSLNWLNNLPITANKEQIVNIHAGFDETSDLLKNKFPNSKLSIFDFYDPVKHTEISIKRARKAYPSFPETLQIKTSYLPLPDNSADKIFTIFSAHEIRNPDERIVFFRELNRVLKPTGQLIVTEHLRDSVNFLVYNIGFFHFHSKSVWFKTFKAAELIILNKIKITPFITTFILGKNGITS